VAPSTDITSPDSIPLKIARKAHTITAAREAVRPFQATTEHMIAAVARLGRAFLGEVAPRQPIRIIGAGAMDDRAEDPRPLQSVPNPGTANEYDVSMQTAAPLENQNAVAEQIENAAW
jgi:hypothetical protein